MKKLIAAFALLALSCAAFADDFESPYAPYLRPQNEVALSYGRASVPGIAMTLGGIFGTAFSFGLAAPEKMASTGAFSFEYFRYVHPRVAVGAVAAYENFILDFKTYAGKDEDGKAIYKSGGSRNHQHFLTIMPSLKVPYFCRQHVGLYGKVAVGAYWNYTEGYSTFDSDGVETVHDPTNKFSWAMQVTPIGVDFGGWAWRGFAELGFGMQGLISLGCRYSF